LQTQLGLQYKQDDFGHGPCRQFEDSLVMIG